LQQAAQARGLTIHEEVETVVEGWAGKPKSLLWAAWEQGFIDPNVNNPKSYYTISGQKNGCGINILEKNLKHLIARTALISMMKRQKCVYLMTEHQNVTQNWQVRALNTHGAVQRTSIIGYRLEKKRIKRSSLVAWDNAYQKRWYHSKGL
jgi:hypothetical protein